MHGVTGIGGVFFKSKNPKRLTAWYRKHLGVPVDPHGYVVFHWRREGKALKTASTVWCPFPDKTTYYRPSRAPFMINYRVKDLDAMLRRLRRGRVNLVGEPQSTELGRFAWGMDPEGNKFELWEPPKGK
ncbi:MAG: VOC family protein [Planctomycetes bacterium]|nr:VOC family protein [Planctomycetota bacterium]